MEQEMVIKELNSFLQNTANRYEFSYEVINLRSFMRNVFGKDENVWGIFSEVERSIINKYENPKKRIQWMAGRYAGKMAIKKLMLKTDSSEIANIDVTKVSIKNGANSAPFIEGYPHLNISISHSYPYCVALVSKNKIGVDIEKTMTIVQPMLKFYYTTNEINEINKLSNNNDNNEADFLATLYWTRKEAISKLQKVGMNLDFRKIDTVNDITILQGLSIDKVRTVSIQNKHCSLSLAFEERVI
ncbi:4'-phosphopantetheinyl transferase superfamily protein [Ruminiclostridium herbifermentans]|uniref:4'-phosphopantetheinyl transferase superfamily protein n=1 Tax=Ruminiclostridium herbifermentans TaxID=2488810 RepID=A0A7H1VNA4_9FIRM|nr:4'-phosphopantetheinyl transferase superfamily protein [Ruminiclostridium herbifermentans]QNU66866.1 4'-phosphopantetheinyl transferase superfamily protein [Ruminiclostridium herbifermentans]